MKQAGVEFLIHYLDDFLVIEALGSSLALRTLMTTFNRLGLQIAAETLEGPSTCLTFPGFEINLQSLEISIQIIRTTAADPLLACQREMHH